MGAHTVGYWPLYTEEGSSLNTTEETRKSWVVPLFFKEPAGKESSYGLRPIYSHFKDPETGNSHGHFAYPLINFRKSEDAFDWDIFKLIQFNQLKEENSSELTEFNLFPFVFYRKSPDPENSHLGVFPLLGKVHNKFSQDHFTWGLFPLYGKFERNNVTTTTVPWPFIKILKGEGNSGFEFWPLWGQRQKENTYHNKFFIWPLIYHNQEKLWKDIPDDEMAFLPFYHSAVSENRVSKSYFWPFFGYTDSKKPNFYETRYFAPFFVQGRGENRYINRWAPFYTHSIRKGIDKTWYMWPIFREQIWDADNVHQTKTQVAIFVYWNLKQESLTNPNAAPAVKRHAWPLFSSWDNGNGTKQFQLFSPLEVFFQQNQIVRTTYNPLFAIYRKDQRSPKNIRHNFLFNFISYHREEEQLDFDIGPFLSINRTETERVFEIGKGLFSIRKTPEGRKLGFFWLQKDSSSSNSTSKRVSKENSL